MKPQYYIYLFYFILFISVVLWFLYYYYFQSRIHINNAIQNAHLEYGTQKSSAIPNKIWSYWNGPMNSVVEKSVESWRHYNPNYEIIMIDRNNLHKYCNVNIDNIPVAGESDARYSDFVRLNVLSHHGGIWMDATCICHKSLDWIHGIQNTTGSEFIGYYLENNSDPKYLYKSPAIEAWFFACVPNSRFVLNWKDAFMNINNFHSVDEYLENLLSYGVSFQKYTIPNYLAVNMAAQYVFQILTSTAGPFSLYLMKAENSAFLPVHLKKWNNTDSINELKGDDSYKKYHSQPIIKLMKGMRDELIQNPEGMNKLFSHISHI